MLVVGEPGVGKSVALKGAAHTLAGEVLLINLRDLPASVFEREGQLGATVTEVLAGAESHMPRRARPDPRLRRPTSSKGVEFEDSSTLGRFHRKVEIDLIDDANEVDTERYASRERTKDVAKEPNSLCRVQLGRTYFFFPAAYGDGRAARSAQVAHPLDLAPGGPDPTPA